MTVLGLGYVGFESPEAKRWEAFGPEVIGFGLAEPGSDGSVRLRLDDRHHRLSIHPGDRDRLAYIGWETAHEDDFEATVEHLERAMHVRLKRGTDEEVEDRAVLGLARFCDPAGHTHELFWGQGQRDRSFVPGRPGHRGFVTGEHGLGHVVVFGPNRDDFRDFFVSGLGFRVTIAADMPGIGGVRFLSCGTRHHTYALLDVLNRFGLQHLMVQCEDLDDVGLSWDRARRSGWEIPIDLGRHRGDHALSFYVLTPSGFMLEVAWGSRHASDLPYDPRTSFFGGGDPGSLWGHQTTGEPQILLAPPNVVNLPADAVDG